MLVPAACSSPRSSISSLPSSAERDTYRTRGLALASKNCRERRCLSRRPIPVATFAASMLSSTAGGQR
jgi:hypothetical protein